MSVQKLRAAEQAVKVPFMDLASLHSPIQKDIEREISKLASSSSFILGPAVERFENNFAAYCETGHAVGCNSGTSAIHMALCALGIGPGDEVITVSHTFVGTVWGILYCGAKPVFVDINSDTMNIDVAKVEAQVNGRTKAILPVHLYGQPVDMDPLMAIARKHGLYVIEDAAQAHGARYKGRRVGSLGDIACFSFYPGKNLGAWGEAGAVVTADRKLAERLKRIRDHGQPRRYCHSDLGFNYRMDAIQAAVLDVKLRHLDAWNERRAELSGLYHDRLSGVQGLRLPIHGQDAQVVHHLFVIRHVDRDVIGKRMEEAGVSTGLHYPIPVHKQPAICGVIDDKHVMEETDHAAATCLSLPLHPTLSDSQLDYVSNTLVAAIEKD